jgi:hypothetical protein
MWDLEFVSGGKSNNLLLVQWNFLAALFWLIGKIFGDRGN